MPDHRKPRLVSLRIQHRKKVRRKLPSLIFHRKILLVVPHHRHQNLLRQREVLRLEPAHHHRRPLRKLRYCLDQLVVLTPPRTLHRPANQVQLLANSLTPHLHIRHDKVFPQRLLITTRTLHLYPGISRQHPMPEGHIPCRLPAKCNRYSHSTKQRHHPPHRTHKPLRTPRPPVHSLRPVDPRQFFRQLLRDHLRRGTPRLNHRRRQVLPPGIRHGLQSFNRHPCLLRERRRRRSRRPVLISHLHRRPHHLLRHILLPRRHLGYPHRQPSRRSKTPARHPRPAQPLPLQHPHHAPLQLRLRPRDHPRRNLLQPDLKQKLRHRSQLFPSKIFFKTGIVSDQRKSGATCTTNVHALPAKYRHPTSTFSAESASPCAA